MSITIHSKTRFSQSFELTSKCACPSLPCTTQTVVTAVVSPTGRAGPHNKDTGLNSGIIYSDKEYAPTLTLRAREKRTGLPDAVADASEVQAAAKAGLIAVIKEGSSVPASARSKDAGKSIPA